MYSLFEECDFQTTTEVALLYCFSVAVAFVASLYVFVPAQIRALDRDDARQIQWRCMAVTLVSLGATFAYPQVFCQVTSLSSPTALEWMGWTSWESSRHAIVRVLLHSCLLYLGPILTLLLEVHVLTHESSTTTTTTYLDTAYCVLIQPIISPLLDPRNASERWSHIRNLLVAPVTEEVVFRGCMVAPLLMMTSSSIRPLVVTFLAPLFFGIAHFHHALLKLRQGMPLGRVAVMTLFQLTYTTLFGGYATYALLRTGSILAVIVSHAFCNHTGLPQLDFLHANSGLYRYRWLLLASYVCGIGLFVWGLVSDKLLPLPSRLVERAIQDSGS
jgi:prenyl protein peptidase